MPAAARKSPPQGGGDPPRYLAIAALVRDRIATEQLGPHTLLPSERELAEQHGVSRRPPRGTFVAEPRVRFHIGSFSEEVSRLGRRPAARLLWAERQQPTPAVQLALALPDGAAVHVFHRLRSVDDAPVALETTFLPADLTPGILDTPEEGSLWAVLRERYGMRLARSTAVRESIVLDDTASSQLAVRAGSAGTLLTRRTEDDAGRCVEYARDVYRADRAAFEVSEVLTVDRTTV